MFVTSPLCSFYRRNYPCLPPFPWNLRIIKGIGTGRFQADVLQIFKKADVPFLRCHKDLDLDLCDFRVMNLIFFEANQGEMNGKVLVI